MLGLGDNSPVVDEIAADPLTPNSPPKDDYDNMTEEELDAELAKGN